MKPGDVVNVRSLRSVRPSGWTWYGADQGAEPVEGRTPVFTVLILGVDILEEPKLDPAAVLREMGWVPAAGDQP